jgi:hypothetical protein
MDVDGNEGVDLNVDEFVDSSDDNHPSNLERLTQAREEHSTSHQNERRERDDSNNHPGRSSSRSTRARINEIIFNPIPDYGSRPIDKSLSHLFRGNRFESVTLQDLRDMDSLRSVNFIDVQILRIIVQPRGANNQAYTYSKMRPGTTRRQINQINYSRLFLVRIHNPSESDRVAYMME